MNARILNGKTEANRIEKALARQVAAMRIKPVLATIIVGQRFDSLLYVRLKEAAAKRVGIRTRSITLPSTVSQQRLIRTIKTLNRQTDVTGTLLQLPLPSHLETNSIISAIGPEKDVDGLRADSKIDSPFLQSIIHLVRIGQAKFGRAVILARDTVFRDRLTTALSRLGYRVTADSARRRIPPITKTSSCIVIALGSGPRLLARNITAGTVIVDAGIRQRESKTIGDVDASVFAKAKAVSPVPGGVGPLTVAYLMKNILQLAKKRTAGKVPRGSR